MADVIQFPNKTSGAAYLDQADEMVASPDIARRIEGACRALVQSLCRGTVKPDKFFIVYEEKDIIAFECFDFAPDELLKTVNAILAYQVNKAKRS